MPRSTALHDRPADATPSVVREDANGFVWHTTGSGKTLTSFKVSILLKGNDSIHKCAFVVDRKDLGRQTRENWSSCDKTLSEGKVRRVSACSSNQFNRFQEGCVEENTNTAAFVRRLLSEDYADKVIVTAIQKLGLTLDESKKSLMQQVLPSPEEVEG